MKNHLIISLSILLLGLAACNTGSDEPPPTEFRIITGEASVQDLQATITYLETRQSQPLSTATLSQTTQDPIGQGVVINGDAVMFGEPSSNASEMGIVPQDSEVLIFEETEPDRIGLVFYKIQYETLVGWVASTQISQTEATTVAIQPTTAVPVTPSVTYTPSRTPTFTPTATPTVTATSLPRGFPTPEVYSVVLVEQIFERGRMIWFEPLRQIWVLEGTTFDPASGTWKCYLDEFVEGMPERDPTMNPQAGITTASQFPDAFPQQPVRGFGQIWRDNDDVRNALGWAITTETKYTSRYEYHAGGEMDGSSYEPAPGEYQITSLYQWDLFFTEDTVKAPCEEKTGTWRTE